MGICMGKIEWAWDSASLSSPAQGLLPPPPPAVYYVQNFELLIPNSGLVSILKYKYSCLQPVPSNFILVNKSSLFLNIRPYSLVFLLILSYSSVFLLIPPYSFLFLLSLSYSSLFLFIPLYSS